MQDSANTGLSAAALEASLIEATTSEARLRAQLQGLVDRRGDLLVDGSDQALDEVECDLATVTRQLDRLELRIPLLRTRHAEQLAAERIDERKVAFEAAVADRLAAAKKIDGMLTLLDEAMGELDDAGDHLFRLGFSPGSAAERNLLGALARAAPRVEKAFSIVGTELIPRHPLAWSEAEQWDNVRRGYELSEVRVPRERNPATYPSMPPADARQIQARYGIAND